MKKSLLFLLLNYTFFIAYSQDFSNKGKDFWVGYGYHQSMSQGSPPPAPVGAGGTQNMILYFATDQVTTITVNIPGNGYTQTITTGALPTVTASAVIPKDGPQDVRLFGESTAGENKGIHITADKPIVAYAHIYNQSVSGASILFPTNTLGKEYYSINYTNTTNTDDANCWFYVVAVDTGITTVEITPSAGTINHPANIPFTVNLTQGQIYNVMGQLTGAFGNPTTFTGVDLTGSKIKSISSGTGGCKRIGVFSGSGRISISCDDLQSSSDNYMVQDVPRTAWGKKYLTVPSAGYNNVGSGTPFANNIYRVCVLDPATVVTVNGAPVGSPIQNNFYYEIPITSAPLKIEGDQPIMVAQYLTSRGECSNGGMGSDGDPETIYLSPVEQNINKVIWNACARNAIDVNKHYINVVIPNTGSAISSFRLDGAVLPASTFTIHPRDAGFSYAVINVSSTSSGAGIAHTIQSDSGFNAIAYGYGTAESYGYNAGTNIRDLYNFITPINPLSISSDPVACTGTPFYFSVTFPFQPTSITWDFHGFQTPNVTVNAPVFDSTYLIGTKRVWRYKLTPTLYTYAPANSSPGYPVTITAGTTTAEGCGNSYERDFDLAVYDPPVADFDWFNNGCVSDTVRFRDTTVYVAGTYSYKWYWNFGDGSVDSVRYPKHKYALPGTYTVKYALISNVGCLSDTSVQQIVISPLPVAAISGTVSVCRNGASPNITFKGTTGRPPFIFTYNINGGPNLTVTTVSGNSISVPVPTTLAGTFIYTLIGVQGENCYKAQAGPSATVIVNPLPTATIGGAATVCQNSPSPNITFTGANATAPYKFIYKINGGPDLLATVASGNVATVAVPTSVVGTFVYTLVSVQDGSTTACVQSASGSVTITVKRLPTATISGSTSVCLNALSPVINFLGANGTAPYIFTYTINGGTPVTVTGNSSGAATVSVPTSIAGTFTYNLVSVKESGGTPCIQNQAGVAVVTVYPLPVADFNYSTPSCVSRTINFTDASSPNAGTLNEWTWNFGDGSPVATTQNPMHVYANPGTYQVKLFVKTNNGCQSAIITRPVIVNLKPVAGFINPEVCLSDTYAEFADTSSVPGGTITAWSWNFGDPASGPQNISALQNPQHSYTTIGTKNVTLMVTSNSGCRDTVVQSFFVNGDIPVANLAVTNAGSLCANDSVAITNTSTVNVGSVVKIDIYWDNTGAPGTFETDDNPSPGKRYAHLYPNFQSPLTRTYRIRFRAYSGETCINDKFQDIVINAAPRVQFNPIPDTCLNIQPFQILQASETGGVPGSYVFSGPGVSSTGIFNPSLVGPGTYMIRYTYTSDKGCVDFKQKQIRILAPPVANFGYGRPSCEKSTLLFSDSSSANAGTLTTWTWDFGDGTTPVIRNNGLPFSHTFAMAGTYDVQLVVTTANGCNSTVKTIPVIVSPLPVARFNFTDTACLPSAIIQFDNNSIISDNTQNSFIYTWNFGDGTPLQFTANPSHTYLGAGPYTVNLKVKSGAGCIHDTSIQLNSIHPQPVSGFSFTPPGVCVGSSVNFVDGSNPADGAQYEWHWDFGDNSMGNVRNPDHTYASPGTFTVSHFIVNSFGCNSDTISKPFTVYPFPIVDAGPEQVVLEGGTVVLQATASGNELQYLWTKDNNISANLFLDNNTRLNPSSAPPQDITYTLTVTGRGGCAASDQVMVKVLKKPRIPNTFSPNNDGINDYWEIQYLSTYPAAKVQIFTRNGQLIFESTGYLKPWNGTMNGKSLPIDTYYYIIEPQSGRPALTGYVTIIK